MISKHSAIPVPDSRIRFRPELTGKHKIAAGQTLVQANDSDLAWVVDAHVERAPFDVFSFVQDGHQPVTCNTA